MVLRPRPSQVLLVCGGLVMLLGGLLMVAPWLAGVQWRSSPEAARAQRNATVATPVWLTQTPTDETHVEPGPPVSPRRSKESADEPNLSRFTARPPEGLEQQTRPTPIRGESDVEATTPVPSAPALRLAAAGFQFLEPPEPGAHARLTISVLNPTDEPAGPITLALPLVWLAGYRIDAVRPAPLDGQQVAGVVRFAFEGPGAAANLELAIDVVAIDEVIDSPRVSLVDSNSRQIGEVRPATAAPPARPGPIYSLDIPRLRLHAGVVPVDWEPPLFVVGQIRTSAHVTQGNSVLVGHLRGAGGYNVFNRLDLLVPGDDIIAYSRGESYAFVVRDVEVLPQDDASPVATTSTPRLTLMTCAGDWNPLTRDYPDRLWVIAEPAR